MALKRALLVIVTLLAFTLPGEAAKRSVHLFGETYTFNFGRDFTFIKRIDKDDGNRQTDAFVSGNRSIVVSASRYVASNTEPLVGRDLFLARTAAEGATGIMYVNDETEGGRGGSTMTGACKSGSCVYRMARAIGKKYWLSIVVRCDACSPTQAEDTRNLADTLYRQLKKI